MSRLSIRPHASYQQMTQRISIKFGTASSALQVVVGLSVSVSKFCHFYYNGSPNNNVYVT
jgi:hypothetical protein